MYRLCEDIINKDSLEEESFQNGLLEYPHYTRPEVFEDMDVPDILLSGHHKKIETWRLKQSLEKTMQNRPDLLKKALEESEMSTLYKKIIERKEY